MTVTGYCLEQALAMAALGFKIVPIGPGKKHPPIPKWQEAATDDPETIRRWLADTNNGIGWAMGLQPNGMNLVALDIDGEEGGTEFIRLISEHPESVNTFKATVQQVTGSKGAHYIFETPETIKNSSKRFADHIDIRGEGGQIVIGPTIHPNGEPYGWVKNPVDTKIMRVPEWVLERVEAMSVPVTVIEGGVIGHNVVKINGDSPKDWAKENFSVYDWALRQGWQPGRRSGDEEEMTRPGKSPRDGHSAKMHHDSNVLNIFTTTIDPMIEQVSHLSSGCYTVNGFDAWMIENRVGDPSEAMSLIRRSGVMPSPAPVTGLSGADPSEAVSDRSTGESVSHAGDLNLPDEFWESRDWLRSVRQAAHARMISADAVLGALITRFATVIPPVYKVPPFVGAYSTFDHISILVGQSGSGKSAAMAVARELYEGPQERKDIMWDVPVPTGEGLVACFFEYVEETDGGKKVKVNRKVRNAVHFSIDEAMSLVSAGQGRKGTTIGSVLCTAWSGGNPGQTNASTERNRQALKPFTFRMSGLAGIQMSLGHHLLADEWVRQGLSGRLVFFAAEDPSIPLDGPEFPEPLELATPATVPLELTYDATIIEEVRQQHHLRSTGQVKEDPIDGHQRLIRLKLSGIMALMDGRTNVSVSDWELAGMVCRYSRRIRTVMLEHRRQQENDENRKKAAARGYYRAIEEETLRADKVKRCQEAIVRALTRYPGLMRRELKDKLDRSLVRDGVLTDALDGLAEQGVIHKPKRGEKGGFRLVD